MKVPVEDARLRAGLGIIKEDGRLHVEDTTPGLLELLPIEPTAGI